MNLLSVLRQTMLNAPVDLDRLNATTADLHAGVAGLPLSQGNMVVAIVSTEDLHGASQQRLMTVAGGTLALVLVLVLIALLQARAIARPLENLV